MVASSLLFVEQLSLLYAISTLNFLLSVESDFSQKMEHSTPRSEKRNFPSIRNCALVKFFWYDACVMLSC